MFDGSEILVHGRKNPSNPRAHKKVNIPAAFIYNQSSNLSVLLVESEHLDSVCVLF